MKEYGVPVNSFARSLDRIGVSISKKTSKRRTREDRRHTVNKIRSTFTNKIMTEDSKARNCSRVLNVEDRQ